MLRATFLVEDAQSASARTRAHDLVPGLGLRGIAARVEPVAPFHARRTQFASLRSYDVVVLQRKLLPEMDLAALRRAARALAFDLDDALPERPFDRGPGSSWTRPRRFADALRAADLVIAGSATLRDVVRRTAPDRRVRLLPVAVAVPSEVRLDRSRGDGRTGEPVRLLWTGSRATLPYLERIGPAVKHLLRRRPNVQLEVVSDAPPPVPALWTRWSPEEEVAALGRADVGLMPLAGDAWSRGKCGLKLALYLAHGVPAVSSRAGAGAEILAPGTGILADDEGEWLLALEALVSDPVRRKAVAVRARAEAAARFSLDARLDGWAAALREAAQPFDGPGAAW